jgi:hypothetical protein
MWSRQRQSPLRCIRLQPAAAAVAAAAAQLRHAPHAPACGAGLLRAPEQPNKMQQHKHGVHKPGSSLQGWGSTPRPWGTAAAPPPRGTGDGQPGCGCYGLSSPPPTCCLQSVTWGSAWQSEGVCRGAHSSVCRSTRHRQHCRAGRQASKHAGWQQAGRSTSCARDGCVHDGLTAAALQP